MNIFSYGKIEETECELIYDAHKRYVVRSSDGRKVYGVGKSTNNVLVMKVIEADMK